MDFSLRAIAIPKFNNNKESLPRDISDISD